MTVSEAQLHALPHQTVWCCAVLNAVLHCADCCAGGDDNTAKVWDLRQRKALYTLPAHTSLISTVRWQPGSGHVLLTAGFDRQVSALSRIVVSRVLCWGYQSE